MLPRFLLLFISLTTTLSATPKIIVSVAPIKYLVESIAGPSFTVETFVPAGASPHSYEPTSRQILDLAKSVIWFRIGENFETKALKAMATHMKVVNLRQGLDLLSSCCCHHHDPYDPHIWLSPKLLKQQAHLITETLIDYMPEAKEDFQNRLALLIDKIDALDTSIMALLNTKPNSTVLVTHPAFGYFCRDYGITQLSIEVDGKEPTPKQMTTLLLRAKEEKLKRVFLEPQHSVKGGLRLAQELNAEVIWLDPYNEKVIENLLHIAKVFAQ